MVSIDPTQCREQAEVRPAVVVSNDLFNGGPADLVIVVPITSRDKKVPIQVPIDPPEGGLSVRSFCKPEDVRSISKIRLIRKLGVVSADTWHEIQDRLRILFDL